MASATLTLVSEGTAVPAELSLQFFHKALTAYYVEERLKAFAKQGKCTFLASARGHEATQIGMALLLKPGYDWFFPYYRSKATVVGLGLPLQDIFLGMLNRQGDPNSRGRNMPEHFSSRELHIVAQTACTGSQYLPAVGMAEALKREGGDRVVYVESGEGATSEGEFFEALNWASRAALPVLFCVQNNGYAISTPQSSQTASSVRRIAEGFGIAAMETDGTSFASIYENVRPMVDVLREGGGPVLVEAKVVRIDPHSNSDDHRKYRPEAEILAAMQRDPVLLAEHDLLLQELLTAGEMDRMREEIQEDVNRAADWADAQPQPDGADLMQHIFAPAKLPADPMPTLSISAEPVAFIDAINHGLREEAERNQRIVMWGEDIADPKGGVFGVTRGLADWQRRD